MTNPDTYIAPVFNRFLDKAERHFKYIVSTSSYVGNLQKKREVLNARKNDINGRIDEGERRSQRPTEEVLVWRNQAVDMLGRIDAALNIAQETTSCVCWICSKHKLGHSCDDMIKEVDDLLGRAPLFQNADPMVDCDTSNVAIPMPYVVVESQELYFAEACKCIADDNSNANIIGVWGLGGVGKTTLLTKIHNHFVGASSMFETVIWTVASSEQSDVSRVQSEIVKNLRLNETGDVHSLARLINKFLENKNFFLFIDDLWKDVDLHKVGVPNPNEGNRCGKKRKVIFTTRSKVVCGNMEARKIIEVKCLDPTQSLILFTEKVGQEVIQSHPGIPKLAEDIAKECRGLPLALITIGRAMSTKLNIDDWKRTHNLLKDSQGLHDLGVDEQLLSVLKISYDYLANDLLKKCFITISMWPEDHMIPKKELIEFWMGIDLIINFESKHEAYQSGHLLIGTLQAACLLEDVLLEDVEDFDVADELVKIHDVLRDLALWLASDRGKNENKWMVKAGIQLQQAPNVKAKWREAVCISLMHNNIKELPSDIPSCHSLLTLVLRDNKLSSKSCFGKFCSLTHLDLSNNRLDSFPESICDLTELRYLNLSSNEITNLPMELRNLNALRYLILRYNCITYIARGVFTELAELLVLDMFHATDPRNISVVVEELKSIEKKILSFGSTVGSEEELSKLMLLSELPIDDLCINDLRGTTFHFMSMVRNTHRLMELEIKDCAYGLLEIVFENNETNQEVASLNLDTLRLSYLEKLRRIIWKDIAPQILFVNLRKVKIQYCDNLEDITWVIHLPSLKWLYVNSCRRLKMVVNNDVDPQVLTFPSLENIYLSGVNRLEKISIHHLAFPQLKRLRTFSCNSLKSLPLEIKTAPKLRKIEGENRWWNDLEWEDDNSRSHFNQFFQPFWG